MILALTYAAALIAIILTLMNVATAGERLRRHEGGAYPLPIIVLAIGGTSVILTIIFGNPSAAGNFLATLIELALLIAWLAVLLLFNVFVLTPTMRARAIKIGNVFVMLFFGKAVATRTNLAHQRMVDAGFTSRDQGPTFDDFLEAFLGEQFAERRVAQFERVAAIRKRLAAKGIFDDDHPDTSK